MNTFSVSRLQSPDKIRLSLLRRSYQILESQYSKLRSHELRYYTLLTIDEFSENPTVNYIITLILFLTFIQNDERFRYFV